MVLATVSFENFIVSEFLLADFTGNAQDADVMETLSKRIFHLFQQDFGEFSQLSPSFHRALAHSADSPDTIKTKVSPSESCQKRRKRR